MMMKNLKFITNHYLLLIIGGFRGKRSTGLNSHLDHEHPGLYCTDFLSEGHIIAKQYACHRKIKNQRGLHYYHLIQHQPMYYIFPIILNIKIIHN